MLSVRAETRYTVTDFDRNDVILKPEFDLAGVYLCLFFSLSVLPPFHITGLAVTFPNQHRRSIVWTI